MSRGSRSPGLPVGNAPLVALIGYGLSRVFYARLGVAPDLTTLPPSPLPILRRLLIPPSSSLVIHYLQNNT